MFAFVFPAHFCAHLFTVHFMSVLADFVLTHQFEGGGGQLQYEEKCFHRACAQGKSQENTPRCSNSFTGFPVILWVPFF